MDFLSLRRGSIYLFTSEEGAVALLYYIIPYPLSTNGRKADSNGSVPVTGPRAT